LQPFTNAKVIGSNMKVIGARDYNGVLDQNIKKAGVFCGLGHPASFQATVESCGIQIVDFLRLQDHIAPKEKELKELLSKAQAKGGELLLCSEKDWVKLPNCVKCNFPIKYIDVTFQIISGKKHYNTFKSDVLKLLNNKD
ncbi:MAG: tetraacyldisaccharide 4'-kinase, partial [Simkaniaceae bacterium]|nr:tetraacyldisaccharide 4'-kinase [Simkaniaceae bacterium]